MRSILLFISFSTFLPCFILCQSLEELDIELEEDLKELELQETPEEEKIFKIVEDMPLFSGCEGQGLSKRELKECSERKLLEFIYQNIKYPQKAIEEKTEGKVIIRFIVERDLTISNVEILKDIGNGCGEEAKRVISLLKERDRPFTINKSRGKPIRVWFTLPIIFKLKSFQLKN